MKSINFYKYQGTGNDFVMIDDRKGEFEGDKARIAQLCHRRFGIGADGLILLRHSDKADFKMVYFNADGGEGTMCGNGGRCIVAFAKDLGIIGQHTTFEAVDGLHEASISEGIVSLKMQDVSTVEAGQGYHFLDTGSPHYVSPLPDLAQADVRQRGRAIRYNDRFAAVGTNVNFVERIGENAIFVRTYERGVEDETLSCGTGVTACALVESLSEGAAGQHEYHIAVKVLGGELGVSYRKHGTHFSNIFLKGKAERVFEGRV